MGERDENWVSGTFDWPTEERAGNTPTWCPCPDPLRAVAADCPIHGLDAALADVKRGQQQLARHHPTPSALPESQQEEG